MAVLTAGFTFPVGNFPLVGVAGWTTAAAFLVIPEAFAPVEVDGAGFPVAAGTLIGRILGVDGWASPGVETAAPAETVAASWREEGVASKDCAKTSTKQIANTILEDLI